MSCLFLLLVLLVRRCTRGFGCYCSATPKIQAECSWRPLWLEEVKKSGGLKR